jgi:hypothetical protein
MIRTGKKIGRNARCPCGSGKKYKHCHLTLDQQGGGAAAQAPRPAEPSSGSAQIAELPGLLKELSRTGPASDRAEFAKRLAEAGPMAACLEHEGEIEAASTVLEAHRAEFEKLLADEQAYMERAGKLFAEECFAPLRLGTADIQRAFDQVGHPATAATDDRLMTTMRAAILHLADKNRRNQWSLNLLLHLPAFVAAGRHLDAWIIQFCSDQTVEFDQECNAFLFAMFLQGYDAWLGEKRAKVQGVLRQLGLPPDRLAGMGPEEIEGWIRSQHADPAHAAKMKAFLEAHPDLHSEAIANLQVMERESVRLLERPDAAFVLLSRTEFEPWLQRLNERLAEREPLPSQPDGPKPPAIASKMFDEVVVPVLREMGRSIFTPARLGQLLGQLREYRNQQFATGNKDMTACATGAITSLEGMDDPGHSYFLLALCLNSLSPANRAEGAEGG